MSETYLNEQQVAEMVPDPKVTARTLRYWRHVGRGPIFSKPSPRTVVYLRSDVDAWLAGNRFARTDKRVAS